MSPTFHPKPNEQGKSILIARPSQPSDLDSWFDPYAVACVVPGGPMPTTVNAIAIRSWKDAPVTTEQWDALASTHRIPEPPFVAPNGYKKAAGVVIREPDGRIWLVAPSNAFAGYEATFPKGTMEGQSPQSTALVETFEESGLQVRLLEHLIDVKRSQSYTRYYIAERVGGNPADMGWESQAVLLAPPHQLKELLNNAYDMPILEHILNLGA
jgi:ADP-ribose pyrophosphatase YjhB (NUDIX family)